MKTTVAFDHLEVHVADIPGYCAFLVTMFGGGRHKVISKRGTAMFISPDGLCIEVKQRAVPAPPAASGFCNPCLRRDGAEDFIARELGLRVDKTVENSAGKVFFFTDREGVQWHIKDYSHKDEFVSW